jgi:hypothetical protein
VDADAAASDLARGYDADQGLTRWHSPAPVETSRTISSRRGSGGGSQ